MTADSHMRILWSYFDMQMFQIVEPFKFAMFNLCKHEGSHENKRPLLLPCLCQKTAFPEGNSEAFSSYLLYYLFLMPCYFGCCYYNN